VVSLISHLRLQVQRRPPRQRVAAQQPSHARRRARLVLQILRARKHPVQGRSQPNDQRQLRMARGRGRGRVDSAATVSQQAGRLAGWLAGWLATLAGPPSSRSRSVRAICARRARCGSVGAPAPAPPYPIILLRRGGSPHRSQALANGEHGASIIRWRWWRRTSAP
jgi:hypothetical protein